MKTDLKVLHLEDSESDVELIRLALAKAGFNCDIVHVATREGFIKVLEGESFDIILADHTLPSFDGVSALGLAAARRPDTPFVFVSGTIGEDLAIDCLKAGATDYVWKARLARLGPAVRRALDDQLVRAQRRESEEAIRKQAELLDLANDTIMVRSLDDEILYWNKGAERLYGWTASEAAGRNCHELLHTQFPKPREEVWDYFLQTENWHGELVQRKKDGTAITVSSSWTLKREEPGKPSGILEISNDITGRLQLEAQFLHAQKMESVGRLASGVAHDFNNLLTVIIGRSHLVMNSLSPEDRLRREVDLIQKTAERAATLTRQLLAFTRKQVIQPKVVDLSMLVLNMDRLLRRLIGEDIDVATDLAPDAGKVRVDPGQMEQVIMNLVVNARDAMSRGGKLTIETARAVLDMKYVGRHLSVVPGTYAMFAVSDTGCGMNEETQSHMFEPFFTTKQLGTGLGLSTVYSIVKQSRGNIWVYSELGLGTTFRVYLPLVDEVVTPHSTATIDPMTLEGEETILLVEDDEAVREMLRETLKTYGYNVLEAAHGGEALVIADTHAKEIQLLITDIVMPAMNGRELATAINKILPDLPVLYMSGYTDAAVIRQGILEPGLNFIKKPFTQLEIASKIREVLGKPVTSAPLQGGDGNLDGEGGI